MKAAPIVQTKVCFACPECGSPSHSCDHLSAGAWFGPWYCDECGVAIRGTACEGGGADIEVDLSLRMFKTLVLLRLHQPLANGEAIHIVVQGMAFQKQGEPLVYGENDEYYYNEHTCPWNYLRVQIKEGDRVDPDGVFVHQETIPWPEGFNMDHGLNDIEKWQDLFPSLVGAEEGKPGPA